MKGILEESLRFLPFCFLVLLIFFVSADHFFFWDTVQLSSMHAHWYVDNQWSEFFLPDHMDSGHPPFWGIYLAGWWHWFGRSLLVSHVAMLPFLFGIIFAVGRFPEKFLNREGQILFLLFLFADPVFLAQATLVSPDVALLCFFLLALTALLKQQNTWLALAVVGLSAVSLRGMMVAAGLGIFRILLERKNNTSKLPTFLFQQWWPFVPGGLVASGFLFAHYLAKGWVGYHAGSPWAPSFEGVDFRGGLYNVGIIGWRFLDFGRVGEWLLLFILFFAGRKYFPTSKQNQVWLFLFSCIACFVLPSMLLKKGLLGHRYLLPLFMVFHLYVVQQVQLVRKKTYRYGIAAVVSFFLITGNCWIYPRNISQGWDSTLAHWPYYELRQEMNQYLEEQKIDFKEVGTAFPNTADFRYIDLADTTGKFARKNLHSNTYFFYSSIFNELTDAELDVLFSKWTQEKVLKKGGIDVILFKRPE